MRWPASSNACAEAPRLLTLAAGWGLGGRGRSWEVAQGGRLAFPGWHRRFWSVRRRGARQLRHVQRRAGRCRPHTRLPRRSVPRWSVGRRGLGRCFGRPVRWLRELAVLPRRPFRPRPRTLPVPGWAPHVACCAVVSALRRVLCADEIVERTSTRARPMRTHDQRRGGRRAPCSHDVGSSRFRTVVQRGRLRQGCQGGGTRRLHGAQVIQRGGAWLRHWRLVGTG